MDKVICLSIQDPTKSMKGTTKTQRRVGITWLLNSHDSVYPSKASNGNIPKDSNLDFNNITQFINVWIKDPNDVVVTNKNFFFHKQIWFKKSR